MKCYICDDELEQELVLTSSDDLALSFYAIVIRNIQIGICYDCHVKWQRVLELLISRFKDQKSIDESLCKKILEYTGE